MAPSLKGNKVQGTTLEGSITQLHIHTSSTHPFPGRLRLQLYEYRTSSGLLGKGAKPPPGHSSHTPFYAFTSWQVREIMRPNGREDRRPARVMSMLECLLASLKK